MDGSYNVVVIMCDELKAKALSPYELNPCRTPHIDELAQSGVRYDAAYAAHPLCVPSRIGFWTSMYSSTHGCMTNKRLKPESLPHAFAEWKHRGYTTGLIGKNHCFSERDAEESFDVWCELGHTGREKDGKTRGMEWVRPAQSIDAAHAERRVVHAPGHDYAATPTSFDEDSYATGVIGAQAERFLHDHRGEPFALWVSFPDPHPPYEVPERFFCQCLQAAPLLPRNTEVGLKDKPERMRLLSSILSVDRGELPAFMAAYYGMIAFIDEAVGRIRRAIRSAGLEQRTIVVFTSDHGDFAGEYGLIAKGGVFVDALTRVPLIIAGPGCGTPGYVEHRPVSLIDVLPTLFRLQGIPETAAFEGVALPLCAGDPARSYVFSEYGAGEPLYTMEDYRRQQHATGRPALLESGQRREAEGRRKMVFDGRYKYVHDPMGDIDELYDLEEDPWEMTNLAGHEELRSVQDALATALAEQFFRRNTGL